MQTVALCYSRFHINIRDTVPLYRYVQMMLTPRGFLGRLTFEKYKSFDSDKFLSLGWIRTLVGNIFESEKDPNYFDSDPQGGRGGAGLTRHLVESISG